MNMKNEPSWCSVGEYLGRRLEQAGIRHYFTVPGDFNLVLLDQLLKNPRLELIGCCNELNAGYAAEGYARSNGIGAFVVTYSVGGLSALNAVACAYAEDLPVVAVGGGINSDSEAEGRLIHHALGEVRYDYQRQIYAQVTAGAFAVRHLDEAPAVIDRAIATALRCRKPVYLEIACNLASLSVPAPAGAASRRGGRATRPLWPPSSSTRRTCSPGPRGRSSSRARGYGRRRRGARSASSLTPPVMRSPSCRRRRACSRRTTPPTPASTGGRSAPPASPGSSSRPTPTCSPVPCSRITPPRATRP